MNIVCDINHPAHVNFLKLALKKLSESKHEIMIVCLMRGKLPRIIEKELPNHQVNYIGKHKNSRLSVVLDANIKRFCELFLFLLSKRIDIGISVGSHTFGLALKILGKPNIQFDDDPERKINVLLERLTSTELFFPPIVNPNGKVKRMNALKEWAYLSPHYFSPNIKELERYNIQPKEYIFVREVSTKSLNYRGQSPNLVSTFAERLPHTCKVLLSLEDKETIDQYPAEWVLLQEPLNDIHSLMYHSKIIISSGDSVAREGSMLGVPSIYCGQRNMSANKMMIDRGMLFAVNSVEVPELVASLMDGSVRIQNQVLFRKTLLNEWDDVTEFILRQIKKYETQNQQNHRHAY